MFLIHTKLSSHLSFKFAQCRCLPLSFTSGLTTRYQQRSLLATTKTPLTTILDQPQHNDINISSPLLREYQQRCITACLEKLKAGQKRQVVSLPVGSGKTVVMANLIPRVPNPTKIATKTLVIAHRTELLDQAQRQIQRFNPYLTVSVEQGRRKVDIETTDVVVASVQTLGRAGSNRLDNYDPALFKTIIIDEAHHAAASTYTRILDHFGVTHPDSSIFVWGCSATVRRHDGISLSNAFGDIAFHMDFMEMIESGWLSPLKITTVETSVDLSHVGIQQYDFKQSELSQAVNVDKRNDIIVRSWCKYAQNETNEPTYRLRKATLVFAVDIAHTMALCNHFRKHGYEAEYLTSKTPTITRYNILDRFRKGEYPILVNCGILTEGTDIPSIDCILMARPTRSAVLFQQMFGRGMRLFPSKSDCLVIDFVDNFKRSGLVTFPTLMGLDPKTVIQDQDVLALEKKAAQVELQQIKDEMTAVDDTNDTTSPAIRLKITEYDDLQEFMTTSSGLAKNIQQITTNAWVAIGNDQYALSVLGKGLVTLTRQSDNHWTCAFQRTISKIKSMDDHDNSDKTTGSKWIVRRRVEVPLEADNIISAIQGADTWVRHSLLKGSNPKTIASSRFASYRSDAMTDKQRAILKRYKIDIKQTLNKGQAMDLITRLKLGQGRLWRQQYEAKRKHQQFQQQHSVGLLLRQQNGNNSLNHTNKHDRTL
ncbi:P-loop containing nucleoside triphosphate hydrolase protein [Halteromyces radiatus]|uniref:P-loop containing nucleoside triphosphate hydrolase protein n=1 Tax=Halteromyces radiatus TaxID=101107 RepID=UPI00221F1728|nr:P-loop containing nucleoside triphosphate hydrolase protein [Halteromyces radiatus]KAI8089725.1 P-loop containing nucleoside triphosphate hydrolase protein [Halteromyces radiatus]